MVNVYRPSASEPPKSTEPPVNVSVTIVPDGSAAADSIAASVVFWLTNKATRHIDEIAGVANAILQGDRLNRIVHRAVNIAECIGNRDVGATGSVDGDY